MGDIDTTFGGVQRWLIDASAMGDAHIMLKDLAWTGSGDLAQAAPSPSMITLAAEALSQRGFGLVGEGVVIQHRAGHHPIPPTDRSSPHRFALDLTEAPSTFQGGQLLFIHDDGRVFGWAAQRGALMVWQGADPILAQIAPPASPRIMLVGSAEPSVTPVEA